MSFSNEREYKFYQEYEGIKIYIHNEKGTFHAVAGGKEVKRAKLTDLKQQINKVGIPIEVMVIPHRMSPPRVIRIIKVEPSKQTWSNRSLFHTEQGGQFEGESKGSYNGMNGESVYLHDGAIVEQFKNLWKEYEDLSRRWNELRNSLVILTPEEFRVMQAEKENQVEE
jgi:hypothetical protein